MKLNNMFIVFILNFMFAIFECIGGLYTGSFAIVSDAIHDFCDATSIGLAYLIERLSTRKENDRFPYGYARLSVLGGILTSVVLICGSLSVFVNALQRLILPTPIEYDGMIIIAIVGFITNLFAGILLHGKGSLNQRAMRLHLFEDVLGWLVVLIGAIIIKCTQWYWIDAALSILVCSIVAVSAIRILLDALKIFLLKTPNKINIDCIKSSLIIVPGIKDVHSIRVWSLDDSTYIATLHVVANYHPTLKRIIRNTLKKHGIYNSTIEFEADNEVCRDSIILGSDCDCGYKH